jgi:hypothetical protein
MKGTTRTSAQAIVERAAERVHKAMETWNAADLNTVAGSQELLENAVLDIQQASLSLGENPEQDPVALRAQMSALKREVARMTRLVDACSGFQRGLAARLGAPGVIYDASGTARGLQG